MKHLVRAGAILAAILILVLVVIRVMPVPAFMTEFGFHPRDVEVDTAEWASLPIQYVSASICNDCHQSKYNLWTMGNHKTVSCENCHGPARAHLETNERPFMDTSRDFCGTCHARLISRPGSFPQVDMKEMGGQEECVTCHDPHDPRAGMPPQVPHTLEGRSQCQSCHGDHEPWVAPPPHIPHTLEGRTECLSCHGSEEFRGVTLPHIPHSLEGRTECLLCHNIGGIKPLPEDHAGRTGATCLNCHIGE